MSCRIGKSEVIPGVTTLVTPDSKSNLPTGLDREPDSALPPGKATPNAPFSGEGAGSKDVGRDIPKFEMNTPDNDIPDRPRTRSQPGEEYGHPVKEDYGYVTRRSMTASPVMVAAMYWDAHNPSFERVAERYLYGWKVGPTYPGSKRQHHQYGEEKVRSEITYERDKSRRKQRALRRYNEFCKKNRQCQKKKTLYQKVPHRFKRKRGPRREKSGADTFQYDQDSQNTTYPGQNSHGEYPGSRVSPQDVPGGGLSRMQQVDNESDGADPATSRVTPGGQGQFWSGEETYVRASRTAATLSEIMEHTDPSIHKRSKSVKVHLKRADPDRSIWTFNASGSKGETYTVRIKGQVPKGSSIKDMNKAQVLVSCTCDFFRFQGPEYHAVAHGYLYGKPRGTAEEPAEKDPEGKHWLCKHVLQALQLAKGYRLASDTSNVQMAMHVASRFLGKVF